MIPKFVSGSYAKCLILLCITMSGCFTLAKPTPNAAPAQEAPTCPAASMAECDVSNPERPATAAETSAHFAMMLAAYYKTQRNECAALNRAKLACLRPEKEKPTQGKK